MPISAQPVRLSRESTAIQPQQLRTPKVGCVSRWSALNGFSLTPQSGKPTRSVPRCPTLTTHRNNLATGPNLTQNSYPPHLDNSHICLSSLSLTVHITSGHLLSEIMATIALCMHTPLTSKDQVTWVPSLHSHRRYRATGKWNDLPPRLCGEPTMHADFFRLSVGTVVSLEALGRV